MRFIYCLVFLFWMGCKTTYKTIAGEKFGFSEHDKIWSWNALCTEGKNTQGFSFTTIYHYEPKTERCYLTNYITLFSNGQKGEYRVESSDFHKDSLPGANALLPRNTAGSSVRVRKNRFLLKTSPISETTGSIRFRGSFSDKPILQHYPFAGDIKRVAMHGTTRLPLEKRSSKKVGALYEFIPDADSITMNSRRFFSLYLMPENDSPIYICGQLDSAGTPGEVKLFMDTEILALEKKQFTIAIDSLMTTEVPGKIIPGRLRIEIPGQPTVLEVVIVPGQPFIRSFRHSYFIGSGVFKGINFNKAVTGSVKVVFL